MKPGRHPPNDLVLTRLLAEADAAPPNVDSVAAGMAAVTTASVPHNINTARQQLRRPGSKAAASLAQHLADYSDLLTGGMAALVQLHVHPQREVVGPDGRTLLLRSTEVNGEAVVLSALWEVDRLEHAAPRDARLVELDEFRGHTDLRRLTRLLTSWALTTGFVPEHPLLRVASVAMPAVLERLDTIEEALRAVAAVHGAELDLFLMEHSQRDTKAQTDFENTLRSGRYRLLVTLSDPSDKGVWKMARRLDGPRRPFRALPVTRVEDATDELASVVALVAAAMPGRPTRFWGPDARERIEGRVGPTFVLTDRARRHLERNLYPNPERILEHLELLADCAEAWHDEMNSETTANERLEDWAWSRFKLRLALHDKRIRAQDALFTFEGLRLDNRPHVKVDDHVPPSECGRIYFAIDDRPAEGVRRFVVDHVGLHDRS